VGVAEDFALILPVRREVKRERLLGSLNLSPEIISRFTGTSLTTTTGLCFGNAGRLSMLLTTGFVRQFMVDRLQNTHTETYVVQWNLLKH
jgi:hypothetical protein